MTRFVQSRRLKIWDPSSFTTFFLRCSCETRLCLGLYKKEKKQPGRFQPSCLTFRQQVKRINCKSRLNPVSTNAPSYFWQRLLGLSLGTGKENIVQLLSSAVTIPQVIARHISAPVRFLFPSVEYKMNCQSQGPPRNEDTQ